MSGFLDGSAPVAGERIPAEALDGTFSFSPPAPEPIIVAEPSTNAPTASPVVVEDAPSSLDAIGDLLLNLPHDIALVLLAAGCFFIGVILAVITPGRTGTQRRETAVAAPMTFLMTAAIWFPLLSGELITFQIAPIDGILAFFIDGGTRGQMFAFGLVMLLGYHASAVFDFINRVFRNLLKFIESKAPKPPEDPPADAAAP